MMSYLNSMVSHPPKHGADLCGWLVGLSLLHVAPSIAIADVHDALMRFKPDECRDCLDAAGCDAWDPI